MKISHTMVGATQKTTKHTYISKMFLFQNVKFFAKNVFIFQILENT